MLSLDDRVLAVLCNSWILLPDIKYKAAISAIKLEDLQAKHGNYNLESCVITLSTRLFWGDNPSQIIMIDINGDSPPLVTPFSSRAIHTAVHEVAHAIGASTGLDDSKEWRDLSGWIKTSDDLQGYARRWERRPGWEQGPSEWIHKEGTWFARDYARASVFEDFADCVAHVALGWHDFIVHPNGIAKFQYILRHVWRETGLRAMAASVQRWQERFSVHV